jgi:hypothetical protein
MASTAARPQKMRRKTVQPLRSVAHMAVAQQFQHWGIITVLYTVLRVMCPKMNHTASTKDHLSHRFPQLDGGLVRRDAPVLGLYLSCSGALLVFVTYAVYS